MKIAVIGAGAMGSIYGGHLSLKNDVLLVDTNQAVVDQINQQGLVLVENGQENLYHPKAVTSAGGEGPQDLVILFVKALFSRAALSASSGLIGENTYVCTLQNGSGHEEILKEFVREERIIIGTTNDNGAVLGPGRIRHGGNGETNIGMLCADREDFLEKFRETLCACGFDASIHANILQLIWNKLFTNVSLSAVTALLDVPMGYIAANPHAYALTERLAREACAVARGLGLQADDEEILDKILSTSKGSPEGITSICADLRAGRKTEVDTISGSVVQAAEKCGVPAPTHAFVVEAIHALEGRKKE